MLLIIKIKKIRKVFIVAADKPNKLQTTSSQLITVLDWILFFCLSPIFTVSIFNYVMQIGIFDEYEKNTMHA